MPIKNVNLNSKFIVDTPLEFPKIDSGSKNVFILKDASPEIRNAILMGKISEVNRRTSLSNYNLWCSIDFPSVIAIFGRRGTGKSYTLGSFAEGLISGEGDIRLGTEQQAVILFDTLGHFWQTRHEPNERHHAQQLKSLAEWGLNPTSFTDNVDVYVPAGYPIRDNNWHELKISYADLELEDWCGILGADRFQNPMGQLMAQTFACVTEDGWERGEWNANAELTSQTRIASNAQYAIEDLVDCAQNNVAFRNEISGYATSTIRALTSRLDAIGDWEVLDNTGTSIEELFTPGRMSVIKLNGVDEIEKQMIAGILVKKIFGRAEEAKELGELSRVQGEAIQQQGIFKGWVLIDEAHNYCPKGGITPSAEHVIRYAKEGRSLGLGLGVTTQQPAALSTELTSQINVLVSHGLSFAQDIHEAENRLLNLSLEYVKIKNQSFGTDVTQKILRSLEIGQTLISNVDVNRTFVATIRPRLAAHGGGHPTSNEDEQ